MSFEDDEYWDEEYSEYSLMPKSAVAQERQYTRRTEPDRVIPTRRPGTDSSGPVDELAARRQRRAAGNSVPSVPRKPQKMFDSQRPDWLNDPGFSPVDTSAPNLTGDEYDDVDFNRPELGADFDAPEFPNTTGNPQRRDDRFGDFPDDVDEPYDHRDLEAYGHEPRTPAEPSRTEADESGKPARRSGWLRRKRSGSPRDAGSVQATSRPGVEQAPRPGVDPRSGQPGRGENPRRGADQYAKPAASGRARVPETRPDEVPDRYRRAGETGIRRAPQDDRRPGDGRERSDEAKGQDSARRPIDSDDRQRSRGNERARMESADPRGRRPADADDRTGQRRADPVDQRYRADSYAEEYDAPDSGRRRDRRAEGVSRITPIGNYDQRFRPVGAAGRARVDDQAGTGDVQARRHDQEFRGGNAENLADNGNRAGAANDPADGPDAGRRAAAPRPDGPDSVRPSSGDDRTAPASDGPRVVSKTSPPTQPRVISRAEAPPPPRVIKKTEPSAPPRVVGTTPTTPAARVVSPPPVTPAPTAPDAEPGRSTVRRGGPAGRGTPGTALDAADGQQPPAGGGANRPPVEARPDNADARDAGRDAEQQRPGTPGGSPPDTGIRPPAPYPRGPEQPRQGDTRSRPGALYQPEASGASPSDTSTPLPASPPRTGANPGDDGAVGVPPEGTPRPRRSPRTAHAVFSQGDGPWSIVPDEAPPSPHPVGGLARPIAPRPPMEPNRPVSPEAANTQTRPGPEPAAAGQQPRREGTPLRPAAYGPGAAGNGGQPAPAAGSPATPAQQPGVKTTRPPLQQPGTKTARPPLQQPGARTGRPPVAPAAADGAAPPAVTGGPAPASPDGPGHPPVTGRKPAADAGHGTTLDGPPAGEMPPPEVAAVPPVVVPTPRPPADGSVPGRAAAGSDNPSGVGADEPGRHGAPDEAPTTKPGGADRIGAHAAPYMDPDGTLHNLRPIGHLTVSGTDQETRRADDTEFGGKWFAGKAAQTEQVRAEQAPGDTAHDGPHTTEPADGAIVQDGEQSGDGAPGDSDGMVIELDLAGLLNGRGNSAGRNSLTEVAEPGGRDDVSADPGGGDRPAEETNRAADATNRATDATPVEPPPVSAADFEAIRWRLDGSTLREVVDDRDALHVLGERLDGPLADEVDNVAKAGLLSMRAEVYRLLGELGMAAAASRLALAHAESARHVQSIVIAQAGLAHVLRLRGEFAEADRLFTKAAAAPVPETLLSVVHENAGRCCFDQRRHMEALDHFARAVRLGRPDDQELADRVGVCLETVYIHVLRDGWGPYPRHSREILGSGDPAGTAIDEPTSEQPIVRRR